MSSKPEEDAAKFYSPTEEEQEAQRWHQQRHFDKRLLKFFGLLACVSTLGMRFLPEPWCWWALYAGLAVAIVGTLVDACWVGLRQIWRIKAIGKRQTELFEQLQATYQEGEPEEQEYQEDVGEGEDQENEVDQEDAEDQQKY